MQVAFCANCGKHTGHKRNVGIIGKVTALATVGSNYLAYTPRCVICGLTAAEAHSVSPARQAKRKAQRKQEAQVIVALVKLPFQLIVLMLKGFWWLSTQIGKGLLRIDTAIRAHNAARRVTQ